MVDDRKIIVVHGSLFGMSDRLFHGLDAQNAENVYIYVGDAVRWGSLDEDISKRGTVFKTVAASIHTPPAFGSIATGLYPPRHGVFSFDNTFSDDVKSLFDFDGIDSQYRSSIQEGSPDKDSLLSVFDIDESEVQTPLSEVESPFVVLERGPGGHAPYGDYDGTGWEYFREAGVRGTGNIKADYEEQVSIDAGTFERRINTLRKEGLIDSTLVIYTSDHGELLGEGGMLGHNDPMKPELVYVPTVFIHPDIRTDNNAESAISHVDLLPTIIDLLGLPEVKSLDGTSLLTGSPPDYGLSFYRRSFLPEGVPLTDGQLCYDGIFDYSGGHIFPCSSIGDRLSVLLGKIVKSSKRSYLRRNIGSAIRSYVRGYHRYGTPIIGKERGRELIDSVKSKRVDRKAAELTEMQEENLRDLGYM